MKRTTRQLASELGVSQTLVARKRRQGKTDAQIREEARRRSEMNQAGPLGSAETYSQVQLRKETAAAGLKELELRRQRGELVPVSEVQAEWTQIAAEIRDALLGLPLKVAGRLVGVRNESEVVAILRREVRAVLQRVSMTIAGGDGAEAGESRASAELTKGENT